MRRNESLVGLVTSLGGDRHGHVGRQGRGGPGQRYPCPGGLADRVGPAAENDNLPGVVLLVVSEPLGIELPKLLGACERPGHRLGADGPLPRLVIGGIGQYFRGTKAVLDPVHQHFSRFGTIGDQEPILDDPVDELLADVVTDGPSVFDPLDRVGITLVFRILAGEFDESLGRLFQEGWIGRRGDEIDVWRFPFDGLDCEDDPPAGQALERLVPGGPELACGEFGDFLEFPELLPIDGILDRRDAQQRLLDPGVHEPIDQVRGPKGLDEDHRVVGNPARDVDRSGRFGLRRPETEPNHHRRRA